MRNIYRIIQLGEKQVVDITVTSYSDLEQFYWYCASVKGNR